MTACGLGSMKPPVLVMVMLAAAGMQSGCAVVTVAGAAAGAVISVTGAVVSTGVRVAGKVIEKTIDAVSPGPEEAPQAAPADKK